MYNVILIFLQWHVSAHLPYTVPGMLWIRIRISPYGSGSDFYNADPDPRNRIRITNLNCTIRIKWESPVQTEIF